MLKRLIDRPLQTHQRSLSISSQVIPGLIVAIDSVVILSAAAATYVAIVAAHTTDPSHYIAAIVFVWLASILLLHLAGLYDFEAVMQPVAFIDKVVIAFGTTILFLLAAAFALKVSTDFSRIWIGSFAIGACVATLLFRILAAYVIGKLADRRVFTRNVVIIGAGEQAANLLARIDKIQPRFVSILGVFRDDPTVPTDKLGRYPLLGNFGDVANYARSNQVDDVIIALPWSADERIMAMLSDLRELPMNVYLASDLIGSRLELRQAPDHFGDLSLVEAMGRPLAGWGAFQKSALDYGVGFILTVLFLPLMGLIALAIKIDSPGPVLFRQARYGFVNNVFFIYKFRTMKHTVASEDATIQATRNDSRVTRIGRFLRSSSLDELPQLFNVLNGTMSLVGPRPHATDHNEKYAQMIRGYFARHRVKPGITGWAQVNGLRGETKTLADIEARVKHDIYYAENWSVLFDLKILVRTSIVWLSRHNAY